MNILNLNTLNFSGKYINSKYSNPYTTNSILNNKTTSDSVPDDLDRNNIQSLYDYSKDRIKDLHLYYTQFGQMPKWADENTDLIIKKLGTSDVNSSNIEMVLDLIKDKKLPIAALFNVTGHVSKNVEADLDKLFEAYLDNKDAKVAFVPKFKNIDEAANGIEIGDVCQIEGNKNISTKMPDGTIKELFITSDTYLELFPPVERYILCQSMGVGDCYLLAALDIIQQNPNARHKLLEMFRENDDGTVDAALGGFKFENGQAIQKEPNKTIIKDISSKILKEVDENCVSYTTEGIRAIEMLHKKWRQEKTHIIAKKRYEYFGKLIKDMEAGKHIDSDRVRVHRIYNIEETKKQLKENNSVLTSINAPFIGNEVFTKDELEYFRSYFENGEELIHINSPTLIRISGIDIINKLSELKHKDDSLSKYENLVLRRILRGLGETPEKWNTYMYDEILPKKILEDILPDMDIKEFHPNNGSSGENSFKTLGFSKTNDCNIGSLKDELFDKNPLRYMFTATNNVVGNTAHHAYAIQAIDIEGERHFLVRNPHNTLNEGILTYEELCRHFRTIHCAAIE